MNPYAWTDSMQGASVGFESVLKKLAAQADRLMREAGEYDAHGRLVESLECSARGHGIALALVAIREWQGEQAPRVFRVAGSARPDPESILEALRDPQAAGSPVTLGLAPADREAE